MSQRWTARELWSHAAQPGYHSVRAMIYAIQSRHRAGESIRALAADYDISRHSMTAILRRRRMPKILGTGR